MIKSVSPEIEPTKMWESEKLGELLGHLTEEYSEVMIANRDYVRSGGASEWRVRLAEEMQDVQVICETILTKLCIGDPTIRNHIYHQVWEKNNRRGYYE